MRRTALVLLLLAALPAWGQEKPAWPAVSKVEAQPLLAQARRVAQALDLLGQPLSAAAKKTLADLKVSDGDARVAAAVQALFDPLCVAAVEIGKEGATKAVASATRVDLIEQGWRLVLIKVVNRGGSTGTLRVDSPNNRPVPKGPRDEIATRWLELAPWTQQPLLPNLGGLDLEYVALQMYTRDAGVKTGTLTFRIEEPGGKAGPVVSTPFTVDGKPCTAVSFRVLEEDGTPALAGFTIRDARGRIYPLQSKRLAPDFFFQPQIYRGTGETVRLPAGKYTILCQRGPESIPEEKTLTVGANPVTVVYQVKRWIDPARRGWYSGDHHIHAAGCQHYQNPTEGVEPKDMVRHILGEDLKIGCCLTWGPCFDYQKRFFTGKPDDVSRPPYLLRYDIEVSGFGSHQSGHLCLLDLKEQIPAGGLSKNHWPTLGMNTLRWAKKQGAVTGPAHSANGLTRYVGRLEGVTDGPNGLPTYQIPAYNGIGANEYIVQAAVPVPGPDGKLAPSVDFISTMDTDRKTELNMWYHTLNCGFRVRASGETDFPCIYGERVGIGRVYVKVDGPITYEKWVRGIVAGRSYVSDGTTHLIDYQAAVGDRKYAVGMAGSEIALAKAGKVKLTVRAAARLPGAPKVPAELVVNGYPVAKQEMVADGKERELTFEADLTRSSWVAVRIFPHAHTNPFFVLVEGKPIRASKASAEWCLRGVDQCWKSKKPTYKTDELKQAEADYEAARVVYRKIKEESAE